MKCEGCGGEVIRNTISGADPLGVGFSCEVCGASHSFVEEKIYNNCLSCKYQPSWEVIGYGHNRYATKAGYCKKPMPFTDRRSSIEYDEEWNDGLDEKCPAWEEE